VLIATVRTLLFARHADLLRRGLDAKLRTMFKLAPVAIAILDAALNYESVNPAFCVLTGFSAEELAGASARQFFAAEAPAGDRGEGLLPFTRKDGSMAELRWEFTREEITGEGILVVTDITFQQRNEAARENLLASERAARADAERSNRLKEEFLATLSHELRNPLNAILGWSTVLGRTQGLPAPVVRGIQAIERNSKLQAQMIADLLDYAGITFGKMRLLASTIDPFTVVRAALDVVQASAQAAEVHIQATLEEEGISVEADPSRLQQVFWNLLSNAIKFSPKGRTVEVLAARVGDCFRLVVRDHGMGIAAPFLPRIFDRFSQQDSSSTRNHGGLGLGLAIVKQLVDLHGGSITVDSEGEGRGAAFTVSLPISDKQSAPAFSDSQLLRTLDLSGVVALVVEDDADSRELTTRILTDAGARVVEAATATAALECVQASGANVLISDIGMAGQDGYQLLRNLRARGYGAEVLPAIALTAFARLQDRDDAMAAGFQAHLVKPLDAQTLIARIGSLRSAAARNP
jgi:signal transduction histidine kinase/CheY-like chemotaxis protein